MTRFLSRTAASSMSRSSMIPVAAAVLLLTIAAGCAGSAANTKSSTVSDSDFGRVAAGQAKPVEDARAQLALAQDELGRARLSVVNDQHEGELARSDQATASAETTRAAAQSQIGKDSNEPEQMQQARDDTKAAATSKAAADARLAYSKKLTKSQAAQVTAAQRKVDLMAEKVNLAKLQSLEEAAIPAAGKYDRATAMQRIVDAQRAFDEATSRAAVASAETATAKELWQKYAP